MLRQLGASFPTIAVMLAFSAAAAISRRLLETTETRVQIGAFVVIALAFEAFGRRAIGQRASIFGLALNCLAIVITMISVKVALEGPPHVPHWVQHFNGLLG